MLFQRVAIVAVSATILSGASAMASTVGTPLFTTAPADISIVNFFGPGGRVLDVPFAPFDSYDINVTTTIASSIGLPGLVGETLSFTYGVENGSPAGGSYSLEIGGMEVLTDPLSRVNDLLITPPVASDTPSGMQFIFTYDPPFADFGPNLADFPDIVLGFRINEPLPMRTGYEQCNALNECEFSNMPLATVNGMAVTDSASYDYVEGSLLGGTITFYTPGGPEPVAPIPLPAPLLLLLGGLGALVGLRRR